VKIRVVFLVAVVIAASPHAEGIAKRRPSNFRYGFATSEYFIRMKVFYKQYRGESLRLISPDGEDVFYGPDGQQADYPRAFYGAVAVVYFLVQNINGTPLPGDLRMP
jgi:hypothetical protein